MITILVPQRSKPQIYRLMGSSLIVDANHIDYPSVAGRGGSVIITAKIKDSDSLGVDLSTSSINVISPSGEAITGGLTQNGIDFLVFSSSQLLPNQGYYRVVITSVGLDPQNLGFQRQRQLVLNSSMRHYHRLQASLIVVKIRLKKEMP